jgi:hypothetical protein
MCDTPDIEMLQLNTGVHKSVGQPHPPFKLTSSSLSLQVLILFTGFYLVLAIFSNWFRHSTIASHFNRVKTMVFARQNPSQVPSRCDSESSSNNSGASPDLERDKSIAVLTPNKEGVAITQHLVPTADGMEVDETGQLVSLDTLDSDDSISDTGG